MDGYSGYNQILTDLANAPKTAFRTSFVNYFYRVMPFGLKGIDLDPTKDEAITTLSSPTNLKELRSFVGKVSYLRRFIPGLAEILKPLMEQTKKGVTFIWCDQCQKAFMKIQMILADPHTMVAPVLEKPLLLYIENTKQSLGALRAQEQEGVEKLVYYISRLMKGPKLRYSTAEKLVTKSNPVKYLLTRLQLSGRMAQWTILTSCLDIECIRPTAVKGQAVADMLANFLGTSDFSLPQQEIMVIEEQEWSMYFDGLSTVQGGGIEVVLKSPREEHTFAYKLHFPCANNAAEYEALLVRLKAARRLGIKSLKVFGDFELVIKQIEGIYGAKNPSLAAYRVAVQKVTEHFTFIEYKVVNRGENKLVDSLVTLAIKSVLKKGKMTLRIKKPL
ncbi:uncharacterized protein LOC142613438 [Castanea sativa]|uniref:uncharacterized protein LOC142613438 n=1 Tax=Castanea sativa TaxID=21020 RepID=UPI003F650685